MTHRSKPRASFSPYYWQPVRAFVRCAIGNHDVPPGTWVRFRRGDYRRISSCETCLAAGGIHRPTRKVTLRDDGIDVRARQAGGDE